MSIADELEKIAKLHSSGVITSDEFEAHKKSLLSSVKQTDDIVVSKKKVSMYRKIRGVYFLALASVNLLFFNGNSGMIALAVVFGFFGVYLLVKDNI